MSTGFRLTLKELMGPENLRDTESHLLEGCSAFRGHFRSRCMSKTGKNMYQGCPVLQTESLEGRKSFGANWLLRITVPQPPKHSYHEIVPKYI